jgi:hypothetical protein
VVVVDAAAAAAEVCEEVAVAEHGLDALHEFQFADEVWQFPPHTYFIFFNDTNK